MRVLREYYISPDEERAFDNYWERTFAFIHPNWRDTEAGKSIHFHCYLTWKAAIKYIEDKNES